MDTLLRVYPAKVLQYFSTLPPLTIEDATVDTLLRNLPAAGLPDPEEQRAIRTTKEGVSDDLFRYFEGLPQRDLLSGRVHHLMNITLHWDTTAQLVEAVAAELDSAGAGDHRDRVRQIIEWWDEVPQVPRMINPAQCRGIIHEFIAMTTRISGATLVEALSASVQAFLTEFDRMGLTGFIAVLCRPRGDSIASTGCFDKSQFTMFLLACAVQPRLKRLCRGMVCGEDLEDAWCCCQHRGVLCSV